MFVNFLEETIRVLANNGKSVDDVYFVTDTDVWCTWKEFSEKANFRYDKGYGAVEINETLYIVGDNWWLERWEYDGSEGWTFQRPIKRPKNHGIPKIKI
jgi:hypothetical protein